MDGAWTKIQDILRKTVNSGLFKVWISPLRAEEKGDVLHLHAPNAFVAGWVRDRLLDEIREAALAALGREVEITIHCAAPSRSGGNGVAISPAGAKGVASLGSGRVTASEGTAVPPEHGPAGAFRASGTALAQAVLPAPPKTRTEGRLCWRYKFGDFVQGQSNELAFAASRSLCDHNLHSDQLFLSSSPGLGKTHLMQAVGERLCAVSNREQCQVEYLTAEEFATQWVYALKSNNLERFRTRFREKVDILLLEDIHFFQGKQKFQDELLATLRALRGRGAKTVLSSSFLPREVKDLDDQLASRFCSGFLAVIDKPDFELRRRILEAKALLFQAPLPDGVAEMLADRVSADVRQLEACLQNLVLKAKLLNRHITMELACQVVSDYEVREHRVVDMDTIEEFVCRSYGFSTQQLRSKSRKRAVVQARNTAFFLARQHTELSLQDIGRRFNRRHSTVIKGITNVEREMSKATPTGREMTQTMSMLKRFRPTQNI